MNNCKPTFPHPEYNINCYILLVSWPFCQYMGGTQKRNLFIKNCLSICTSLNFSHLQNILHLMQHTYWDVFPLLKTVFELIDWCLLVLLPFFVSPLPHQQTFPFGEFFHPGETKKSCSGWHQVNRKGGAWGSCHFWSKTVAHSAQRGQVCL